MRLKFGMINMNHKHFLSIYMLSSLGSSGQHVVTEQLWEQAQRARLPGSIASYAPWQGVMVGDYLLCASAAPLING